MYNTRFVKELLQLLCNMTFKYFQPIYPLLYLHTFTLTLT